MNWVTKKKRIEILLWPLAFIMVLSIHGLQSWKITLPRPSEQYLAPSREIVNYTFGHQHVIADLLWVRLIQDFDYCEKKINEMDCVGKSWLFRMLDIATELDPKFGIAYRAGATALTVIISDYAGASIIFDKGVERMPTDWQLAYRAAYHAIYEEKNKPKAAALLKQAGQYGAPVWVFSLAGRLWAESGEVELAEALLKEMILTEKDPNIIKRLQDKLESVRKKHKK